LERALLDSKARERRNLEGELHDGLEYRRDMPGRNQCSAAVPDQIRVSAATIHDAY
jgi:hypothetical protein